MMFSMGRTRGRRVFSYGLLAGLASIALAGAVTTAQAATLTGTFGFSVYQTTAGGGLITSADQQANLANPLLLGATIATGTITGEFNFDDNGTNTIDSFLQFGTATVAYATGDGSQILSSAPFDDTTVFLFTGDTGGFSLTGVVNHDDGMSLYLANDTLVAGSPAPTGEIPTNFAGLAGSWKMVYVASNGLPEVLNIDITNSQAVIPLPAALPLFLTALGGMGAIGGWRRRKAKQAA